MTAKEEEGRETDGGSGTVPLNRSVAVFLCGWECVGACACGQGVTVQPWGKESRRNPEGKEVAGTIHILEEDGNTSGSIHTI